MSKMEQSDHIESLIRDSYKREKLADQIQEYYVKCVHNFSDEDFNKLFLLLNEYLMGSVRYHLKIKGCYSDDNESEVIVEALDATRKVVKKDNKTKTIKDTFIKFAYKIYYYKTYDCIRDELKRRKRETTFDEDRTRWGSPDPDIFFEEEKLQKLRRGIGQLYILSLLESGDFPPRCLALFYARLLPHLLSEDPYMQSELRSIKKKQDIDIEDDLQKLPRRKGYSAIWAINWMKKSSVGKLTDESEEIIKRDISNNLAWCEKYRKQLDQEETVNGKTLLVREIIYTETYDQKKTGKWAEDMHNKMYKIAFRRLYEDKELSKLALEYKQHTWPSSKSKNKDLSLRGKNK